MRKRCRLILSFLVVGVALWTGRLSSSSPQSPVTPAPVDSAQDVEKQLEKLDRAVVEHFAADRMAEAIATQREKLELLERSRGKDHWRAVRTRRYLETLKQLAGRPREVRDRQREAEAKSRQATKFLDTGKYAEAVALYRDALATCREILGEDNFETAAEMSNLGLAMVYQGNNPEAEPMLRRSVVLHVKALGEDHPDTATSVSNLASSLRESGKLAEAEANQRLAHSIYLKTLGDHHQSMVNSFINLGSILLYRGKYAEAEELNRKALSIQVEMFGERNRMTSIIDRSLAGVLEAQGKYAEAEALQRRSLASLIEIVGVDHPEIGVSYNNLAETLRNQGKAREAEVMNRRSLANTIKALGEDHRETSTSYQNLASILMEQGKYPEAEANYRHALAIALKSLGEDNRITVAARQSIARILAQQGKLAEAEAILRTAVERLVKTAGEENPDVSSTCSLLGQVLAEQENFAESERMYRRVLAIRIKFLGEDHPRNVSTYKHIAISLAKQGKFAEADRLFERALVIATEKLDPGNALIGSVKQSWAAALDQQGDQNRALGAWASAVESYERMHLSGSKGLEAALTAAREPHTAYAASLVRAGRGREGWTQWEEGLARGVLDEVTRRASRPLSTVERQKEELLLGQAQKLDERIARLGGLRAPTKEQSDQLENLRAASSDIRRELLGLEGEFEAKYGAVAGKPTSLESVQKVLPQGTALIGWIDSGPLHQGCLLRASGDPIWVTLKGSGEDGLWTKADDDLAPRLRAQLSGERTGDRVKPLAESLARQRLEPFKEHLKGIERLVVENSPGLAGVPVEVLLAARPDPSWDKLTVSYTPSASIYVYLVSKSVPRDRPATLLAVADPAYPEMKGDGPAPTPPDSGLAINRVVPNGNASLYGIQPGDVLLSYAGKVLAKPADLKLISSDEGPKKVSVKYWREGITREIEVASGSLGIGLDPRPVKQAVQANQAAGKVLLGLRGVSRPRLPGTRREVEAVGRLFSESQVKTVLGEQACESKIQELAGSGQLKGYRYLHFATHGESDPRAAYRSALILAPDPSSTADPLALDLDGTITAEQIARTWELDADLVVLSACESGLGRAVGGEGYLGFAQPLIAKGARSLILSLWKVDDDATALLMTRFYQNLLGKRIGLNAPLPKAEALSEAKAWLRTVEQDEVGKALASLPRGDVVRRELVIPKTSARPFEDPTYWAGFILVGAHE